MMVFILLKEPYLKPHIPQMLRSCLRMATLQRHSTTTWLMEAPDMLKQKCYVKHIWSTVCWLSVSSFIQNSVYGVALLRNYKWRHQFNFKWKSNIWFITFQFEWIGNLVLDRIWNSNHYNYYQYYANSTW